VYLLPRLYPGYTPPGIPTLPYPGYTPPGIPTLPWSPGYTLRSVRPSSGCYRSMQREVADPWGSRREKPVGGREKRGSGLRECERRAEVMRRVVPLFPVRTGEDWIAGGTFPTVLPWERDMLRRVVHLFSPPVSLLGKHSYVTRFTLLVRR